jgi:hypothetical protein
MRVKAFQGIFTKKYLRRFFKVPGSDKYRHRIRACHFKRVYRSRRWKDSGVKSTQGEGSEFGF